MQENYNPQKTNFYYALFFLALMFALALFEPGHYSLNKIKKQMTASLGFLPEAQTKEEDWAPKILLTLKTDSQIPQITAMSYLSAYVEGGQNIQILAEKNSEDNLPIASLTKLMTAIIAYKNYDLNKPVTISEEVANIPDDSKRFIAGSVFKIKDLIAPMLVESNNNAAEALAREMGKENFVRAMNEEARRLGMTSAYYSNPIGLDPRDGLETINHSTAQELLLLVKNIIKNYPDILKIMGLSQYEVRTASGSYNHTAISTNLFFQSNDLSCDGKGLKILAGKTGTTNLAKKNLILITNSPRDAGYLINIILGSDDNFADAKKLTDWLCQSYQWSAQENQSSSQGSFNSHPQ